MLSLLGCRFLVTLSLYATRSYYYYNMYLSRAIQKMLYAYVKPRVRTQPGHPIPRVAVELLWTCFEANARTRKKNPS
jgi:hypothetical protein